MSPAFKHTEEEPYKLMLRYENPIIVTKPDGALTLNSRTGIMKFSLPDNMDAGGLHI